MLRVHNPSLILLFWALVPTSVSCFLSTKTNLISTNKRSAPSNSNSENAQRWKIISNDILKSRERKFPFIATASNASPSSSSLYSSTELNDDSNGEMLTIEYCTGCRWLLRSAWLMQEIFTTFDDEMGSITLIPSKPPSPGGTFEIKLNNEVVWDRRVEGGFPEAKQLKQRIRDKIAPTKSLGHSDTDSRKSNDVDVDGDRSLLTTTSTSNDTETGDSGTDDCEECNETNTESSGEGDTTVNDSEEKNVINLDNIGSPNVKITYCTGCKWMLRSAWICQELLTTFEQELNSVTLVPNRQASGLFTVKMDEEELVWDRKADGGFPEIKVLKQRVRDIIAPERNLGHSDKHDQETVDVDDDIDDEEAANMRNFYGVL